MVQESTEFSSSYIKEIKSRRNASFNFEEIVEAYTGPKKSINWIDEVENKSA